MSLNRHQREYMEHMNQQKPEDLCWCGWYLARECGAWCGRSALKVTKADRLRESCSECGDYPFNPGGEVVHRPNCSHAKWKPYRPGPHKS